MKLKIEKSTMVMGAVALMATGTAVYAALPKNETIAKVLHARLPKTKFDKIDCTKMRGLCEVQAGNNLFYTDQSGRYLIVGRIYDMDTRQDMTAASLMEMNPSALVGGAAVAGNRPAGAEDGDQGTGAIKPQGGAPRPAAASVVSLAKLPNSGAIEWGSGSTSITVFSDFHCTYCRLLHTQLRTMNVRVIERPISVLGTRFLSDAVLCSPDPRKSLMRAYDQEDLAPAKKCDTTGLDANEAFAREHGFDGTPVIVRSDGAVLQGFRPKEFLEAWLKGAKS